MNYSYDDYRFMSDQNNFNISSGAISKTDQSKKPMDEGNEKEYAILISVH